MSSYLKFLANFNDAIYVCVCVFFFPQFLYFTKSIGIPYVVAKVGRFKVATKYLKSSLDYNETFTFKEE